MIFRVLGVAKRYKWLLIAGALSTLILTVINLAAPMLLSQMVAYVKGPMDESTLNDVLSVAFLLLGLYICKILFRFMSSYLTHKAAWNAVRDVRMQIYNHIQSFSMSFFHNKQTGDLMSRVVNDTALFEQLYAHLMPETITNFCTLAGVTIILFFINAKLALMTCIPIPFILCSGWIFSKKIRPNFRATQRSLAGLNAQLQDNLSGIHEIQAFGQQERESVRVHTKATEFTKYMLHALKLSAVFHPSVEFLTSLGTVIVVGFGGYMAFLNQLDVEDIVAFLLYLSLFYAPITGLAQLLEQSQQALAGTERVLEIMDEESEIKDKPGAVELPEIKGHIIYDDVSFSYIKGVPVVENISFEIKPGQMLALVGPTGVGKTTLIQLMARFYDPQNGKITIDGYDLRDIMQNSLRNRISMVLQDTFLFNGTIAENISYARQGATMEEIIESAKVARIYDDIMEMPDGFDTEVGERGVKLSGGQKQRVAIARAILRDAPVLILDEATASVDMQTESQIQAAIQELSGTRTIIAIAHRLSTIKNADMILVFNEGTIVQRGTHEKLIKEPGMYMELCRVQEQGARLVG